MVKDRDKPPKRERSGRRRRAQNPEEIWVRAFFEYSGTENVTGVILADMGGVSLTRAVEALRCGECVRSEKCNGPGVLCTFGHESDTDAVEVGVFFEAAQMELEIRWGRVVKEVAGEPDAA